MQGRLKAAALLLAIPVGAVAAPEYDYLQADRLGSGELSLGEAETDYDGYGLEWSTGLGPGSFLDVRYLSADADDSQGDFDRVSVGIGGHFGDGEHIDFYGIGSFERLDLDGSQGSGFGLTAGTRITPASWIEIDPSVGYVDYGEVQGGDVDGFRYRVRMVFNLNQSLGLALTYRGLDLDAERPNVSPDPDLEFSDEISVGLRWCL